MPELAHNFFWNRIWCCIDAFKYRVESFHGSSAVWAAKLGRLSPFCWVCRVPELEDAQGWGTAAWFCPVPLGLLKPWLKCPVLLGTAQVPGALWCWESTAHWAEAHLQAAPAVSLRRFYLASVLVISRNFGKSLKDPPNCCAGELWDTLGFFSPAVLGFITLGRSTKLSST